MLSKYYLKKGWKRYTERAFEGAIKYARKVRTNNPELRSEANRIEGLSYNKMRIYDLSIFAFERAVKLTNYKTDWFNMAMCLAKKGDTEKANRAFQNIYMAKTLQGYMHQITIPEMLFQFARIIEDKKDHEVAFKRIVELKQMYIGANTSDSRLLAQKGLPSINAYKLLCKKILKGISHPTMDKWLSELPQ